MRLSEGDLVTFQASHKIHGTQTKTGTVVNRTGKTLTLLDSEGYLYQIEEHECYPAQGE